MKRCSIFVCRKDARQSLILKQPVVVAGCPHRLAASSLVAEPLAVLVCGIPALNNHIEFFRQLMQEDHNFANDLLFSPGGSDAAGSDCADASDLTQAIWLCLDRIEYLFAEGAHKLLGVDWSNAAYHARAEVFFDAVERRRLRGLQKLRLKLLAVGAIVDPLARRRNPLTGRDDRSMPDHRNQFPVSTCLDPQDAKAGFIVVKSHALNRAR